MVLRAFVVWLIIITAETAHGILRGLILVPQVGDLRARQIGVFIGSAIILLITYLFIKWIAAKSKGELLAVGLIWLILTLSFEFVLGYLVLGFDMDRMLSDYDIANGGLMLFGLVILLFSPMLADRVRSRWTGPFQ